MRVLKVLLLLILLLANVSSAVDGRRGGTRKDKGNVSDV